MAAMRIATCWPGVQRLLVANRMQALHPAASVCVRCMAIGQRRRPPPPPLFPQTKDHAMRRSFDKAHAKSVSQDSDEPIEQYSREFIRKNKDILNTTPQQELPPSLKAVRAQLKANQFDEVLASLLEDKQTVADDYNLFFDIVTKRLGKSYQEAYQKVLEEHSTASTRYLLVLSPSLRPLSHALSSPEPSDAIRVALDAVPHPAQELQRLYLQLDAPLENVTANLVELAFRAGLVEVDAGFDALAALREKGWISDEDTAYFVLAAMLADIEDMQSTVTKMTDPAHVDEVVDLFVERGLTMLNGVSTRLGLGVDGRMAFALLHFTMPHSDHVALSLQLLRSFFENEIPVHVDAMHHLLRVLRTDTPMADALMTETIERFLKSKLLSYDTDMELVVLYVDMMINHSNLTQASKYFSSARHIFGKVVQRNEVEALELYKQIIPLLEDKEHHQRFRHLMMSNNAGTSFADAFVSLAQESNRLPFQAARILVPWCIRGRDWGRLISMLVATSNMSGGFALHPRLYGDVQAAIQDPDLREEFEAAVAANRMRREQAAAKRKRFQERRERMEQQRQQ